MATTKFTGTYATSGGDKASGSVKVTPASGDEQSATLDGDGSYTIEIDTNEASFTITETIGDGPPVTRTVMVLPGAAVDTGNAAPPKPPAPEAEAAATGSAEPPATTPAPEPTAAPADKPAT